MPARNWIRLGVIGLLGASGLFLWWWLRPPVLPAGFAGSNGRMEAVEIDVATKTAGRVLKVLVDEGDFVQIGQVLAQMDTESLKAQLREAEADLQRAKSALETANSTVIQRMSEKTAAQSVVAQREAEYNLATKKLARAERLAGTDAVTAEDLDTHRAEFFRSKAAVDSAKANVAAAEAAITTAKSFVDGANEYIRSSKAKVDRIQVEVDDCTLKATRDGRVQYRVADEGEILGPGGKVLNVLDLSDVYMTFFLPTSAAGRIQMGAEARLVLDAAPQYVVPAKVIFVADVAQFTPKTVETTEERVKLMFRVKARVDPELLKKHLRSVKTGLPGMAYVRLDENASWPAHLEIRLPQP